MGAIVFESLPVEPSAMVPCHSRQALPQGRFDVRHSEIRLTDETADDVAPAPAPWDRR